VCRSLVDEFLVIVECGLANAVTRSQQMANWLAGSYRIPMPEREIVVEMKVSVEVVERWVGRNRRSTVAAGRE
jgi:hypothetical protein